MSEMWELGNDPHQAEVMDPDSHMATQSCGCPMDYHMADCPIRTGDSNVYYSSGSDDYYDDHPPEGME